MDGDFRRDNWRQAVGELRPFVVCRNMTVSQGFGFEWRVNFTRFFIACAAVIVPVGRGMS